MAEKNEGRVGSFPFYANGPHHSNSYEQMPRYERKQGCVPQSTTLAGAWVENVEKEEKLHETLVRLGVRPSEVSYAAKQPVVTGRARAQYLTEEQRSSRREYRQMKKQLKLEKQLRRAMADEIATLVRPVAPSRYWLAGSVRFLRYSRVAFAFRSCSRSLAGHAAKFTLCMF